MIEILRLLIKASLILFGITIFFSFLFAVCACIKPGQISKEERKREARYSNVARIPKGE